MMKIRIKSEGYRYTMVIMKRETRAAAAITESKFMEL